MITEYLFCSKRYQPNNDICDNRCFECRYFTRMCATQIRKKFNVVPEDLVNDNVMFAVSFVDDTVAECSCSERKSEDQSDQAVSLVRDSEPFAA